MTGEYEAACRREARRRSAVAFLASAAVALLSFAVFTARLPFLATHLFSLRFWWSASLWTAVSLAMVAVRRHALSLLRKSLPVRFGSFIGAMTRAHALLVAVYAVGFATCLRLVLGELDPPGWGPIHSVTEVTRRDSSTGPPVTVNHHLLHEGMVVLLAYGCLLGVGYAVRELRLERLVLSFPTINQNVYFDVKRRIPSLLVGAVQFSAAFAVSAWLLQPFLQGLTANIVLVLFGTVTHLSCGLAGAVLPHTIAWALRVLAASTCTVFMVDLQAAVMEAIITQPMKVSQNLALPSAGLVEGVKSRHTLVKWHAHLELWNAVMHDSRRRQEIFDNFDAPSGSWSMASGAVIDGLASFTASLTEARGLLQNGLAGSTTSRPALPSQAGRGAVKGPVTGGTGFQAPLADTRTRAPIKPVKQSTIVDTIVNLLIERPADEQATQQSLEPVAQAPAFPSLLTLPPADGLRQRAVPLGSDPVGPTAPASDAASGHSPASSLIKLCGGSLPEAPRFLLRFPWGARLLQPSALQLTRALFADAPLQLWRMGILAQMVTASRTEDAYGSAQQTLPLVLTTLFECLASVEAYAQAIPPSERRADGHQLLLRQPQAIADGLQSAIYMITTAFYESLKEVRLNQKHAVRLQAFLDFAA